MRHANHFLDTVMPVLMSYVKHLRACCYCYVSKMLFSFPPYLFFFVKTFIFRLHIDIPKLLEYFTYPYSLVHELSNPLQIYKHVCRQQYIMFLYIENKKFRFRYAKWLFFKFKYLQKRMFLFEWEKQFSSKKSHLFSNLKISEKGILNLIRIRNAPWNWVEFLLNRINYLEWKFFLLSNEVDCIPLKKQKNIKVLLGCSFKFKKVF